MSQKKETTLDVRGMTCQSCVGHVSRALLDLNGVSKVEVRLREGRARVEHDARTAPQRALIEALREAGYESSEAST